MREMRVLIRIVRVSEHGLAYEPDPRHCELLKRDIGFADSTNSQMAPGINTSYDETKHAPAGSLKDITNAIRHASKQCNRVTFGDDVNMTTYDCTKQRVPADCLLHGPM